MPQHRWAASQRNIYIPTRLLAITNGEHQRTAGVGGCLWSNVRNCGKPLAAARSEGRISKTNCSPPRLLYPIEWLSGVPRPTQE